MMTLHSIHLVKLPPMENVDPPSNRRAMAARSRQISAIAGRSWMRSRTISPKSCGVGIRTSVEPQAVALGSTEVRMPTPQLLEYMLRLLLQLLPAMALVCLLLAGIALRLEGGSTFSIGGSFTKWMLWSVITLTLPQLLLWLSFFGLPVPSSAGAIGTNWLAGIHNDVSAFVSSFIVARLTIVLAAYFVIRAVLDAAHGGHPLGSFVTRMFLLAIPPTANLISSMQTSSRFAAVDVLDGLWNYLAGQIMPAAAGLAVVTAIINFATHRPAMRLIAAALGFLTVSALWRLVQHMM